MDVKEAVRRAKQYVGEIFSGEKITHVGLEEVVFDDAENCWKITLGFFRPWDLDMEQTLVNPLARIDRRSRRTYKIVQIDDDSGKAVSITNRRPSTAA